MSDEWFGFLIINDTENSIIFYAPVNSLVVYGIPDVGTGSIRIDERVKELTNSILEKMEVK